MTNHATIPWLTATARARGEATAIRFGDAVVTWAELAAEAQALAAGLAALGVSRGDIVAVRAAPHPQFAALLHAVQLLGAALLPLNLRLTTDEQRKILDHAGPRLLVVDHPSPTDATATGNPLAAFSFDDLCVAGATKSFHPATRVDSQAVLTIVYTSGTTAAPKGVLLTNANYAAGAVASRRRLGHGPGDVWLATLPLFHVGGLALLCRSVLEGSSVILKDGFDADEVAKVLVSAEATMISVVPTMLRRVLDRMTEQPSSALRAVLVGGAALSPALGRRALQAGLPISATYGMTEACSQICSTEPGSYDAARAMVGRPLDGVEVRIAESDGEGWGEIMVRGPGVMRGYLRNPSADEIALRDGWLRTGDIGRLDESGRLALSGRRSDLIVTGGENVAPLEVEQALDDHPDVIESLVVGVDDDEWGQHLVAVVVARHGETPTAEALTAWCRARIAAYKVPREFRFVDALPRGSTDKVIR